MALQTETDELIARYIEPDADLSTPDRAWIVDASCSVRSIVRWLRHVDWDLEGTARRFDLPVEAVRAAIAYYERHRPVIDARITLDDAFHVDWRRYDAEHPDPSDALIARHIDLGDGFPTPDDARLRATGVHVTTIIRQLDRDGGAIDRVARAYRVPPEAVRAAIAYYERHKDVIDARITLDSAALMDDEVT
jgi:uncharacterized protein (DUF433 family)